MSQSDVKRPRELARPRLAGPGGGRRADSLAIAHNRRSEPFQSAATQARRIANAGILRHCADKIHPIRCRALTHTRAGANVCGMQETVTDFETIRTLEVDPGAPA